MSRHDPDRFDDDDDFLSDPPRKAKSAFRGLWIGLLIVVPVAIVLLIGGGFLLFMFRTSNAIREQTAHDAAAASRTVEAHRKLTRDTFKAMKGSTPEDVVAAFGQPNTKLVEPARTTWTYQNKTTDPTTGKFDPPIKVVFEGGVVVEVNF